MGASSVARAMAAVMLAAATSAQAFGYQLFPPPKDGRDWPTWLEGLKQWRSNVSKEIGYTGDVYDNPAVNWTRLSYVQPQSHPYDRYLYDPVTHSYTVDRYLADVEQRYGGIDSILLWPTYTNIGIDARNQFEYFRALPGGLPALRDLVKAFKARGVRVLFAYNPWDQSTRGEGSPHWTSLAEILRETGADGFNGDTMVTMYKEFWDAGVTEGYPIVGEMEGGGYPMKGAHVRPEDASWVSANWSPMGWGESWGHGNKPGDLAYEYDVAPGVDRLRWLDGRHMTHVCDRWAKNNTDALQYAFFNGAGLESWENVWGIFMHYTPRDAAALQRISAMFRWLGKERFIQDFAEWEPYTPDVLRVAERPFSEGGAVGSKFRHKTGDCVWLITNRAAEPEAVSLNVSGCGLTDHVVYDLYRGARVRAERLLEVQVEAHGYGAVLATTRADLPVGTLLEQLRNLTAVPLSSLSAEWEPLQQEMVGMESKLANDSVLSDGMVSIPKTRFRFRAAGVEIEGGCDRERDSWGVCCPPGYGGDCPTGCEEPCAPHGEDSRGVDAQLPWEASPARFHDRLLEIGPFYFDKNLVTKGEYAKFLQQSGYKPADPHNFLVGWNVPADGGALVPPVGTERQPVVWVSLQEARLYCSWAGKRLPHVYEWQLAAQGTDGRLYPWGNQEERSQGRFPPPSTGDDVPELPDVGSFSPSGDAMSGAADLVGHVWQYTDEFRDEHTRTVLLKGSSLYTPMVSAQFPALPQSGNWYFPKALQVDRHNRMMLMDDSYERAGTLGFRCVADHPEGQAAPYHFKDLGPPSSRIPAQVLYA